MTSQISGQRQRSVGCTMGIITMSNTPRTARSSETSRHGSYGLGWGQRPLVKASEPRRKILRLRPGFQGVRALSIAMSGFLVAMSGIVRIGSAAGAGDSKTYWVGDSLSSQELEYHSDILELEKDTFREFIEKFFGSVSQDVDRAVLMKQLQDRTGVDLKEKTASGAMSGEALDRLLSATSVEIFPVLLPTKDCGFEGISVYCDDKGVAKGLEENPRAGGLVQAAGYHAQTFRGDIFMGRIFDDNEDIWRRADFTMQDCKSDAAWIQLTKRQRSHRSNGDVASLAGKVGVTNPAMITPASLKENIAKGETDDYAWRQTEEEVEVTFKKEGLEKGDKKLVKVVFGRQKLKVEIKGEVVIDAVLAGTTTTDECLWTLSDGVLQVTLSKADESTWNTLLKA
ncbi:unnamed protein product [Polarella glacialis]|uniref:CS domain-containing protein n=1 Tax=Polarella glacialis TaxID=89957 RepID=A0A813I0U9_POLGL|nr:unnamed protein product [Polarella glacialis]